nr:ATP synthase F0 subunit 8 [Cladonema multiramosum]
MSQLDISISFSQLIGLLFCFYFFIFYIINILITYFYNRRIRELELEKSKVFHKEESKSILVLREILKH